MSFRERLKEKRLLSNLSQAELAAAVGVSTRSIQNYEMGTRSPQHIETVQKIADVLNTSMEYLMGGSGMYILDAQARGGASASRDIAQLVEEVTGLFAGGQLDEEALDGAMKALNDAYWIAKENNRKYAPNKRRRASSTQKDPR